MTRRARATAAAILAVVALTGGYVWGWNVGREHAEQTIVCTTGTGAPC